MRSRPGRPPKGSPSSGIQALLLDMFAEEPGKPASAYTLMSRLKRHLGRPVSPPTVYRALNALLARGRIARIESQAAFVPVCDEDARGPRVFLLCSDCRVATEIPGQMLAADLVLLTASRGFLASRSVIEIEGRCRSCDEVHADM